MDAQPHLAGHPLGGQLAVRADGSEQVFRSPADQILGGTIPQYCRTNSAVRESGARSAAASISAPTEPGLSRSPSLSAPSSGALGAEVRIGPLLSRPTPLW
ncbi:hypothetical protein [Fodinicola feengrottensis]|uniref:hypothetical protein n=1 Tax=Fodinicola feengrottensis TaxID=435914 RepID=UPI002442521B|nr:hypothetical protein [Fodinicola feengrottensis]